VVAAEISLAQKDAAVMMVRIDSAVFMAWFLGR
jgi:hypothetical protein